MTLLVDWSVWSLAFRRDQTPDVPETRALRSALDRDELIVTTGLVLQKLLQGFPTQRARDALVERFAALPFLVPDRVDHVEAASLRTACRRAGVQIGTIDALIAQLCIRHGLTLLTTGRDLLLASSHCPLRVWQARN